MDTKVYIDLDIEQLHRLMEFPNEMGNVVHNIAIMLAPFDTGNLRSAITLMRNTPRKIVLHYSHMVANYIKFLEEGLGSVKKYYGFISIDTRMSIIEALIGWIETGVIPPHLYNPSKPIIDMKSTSNIFSWEQDMLKSVGKNSSEISPNVRRKISMIRELEYRQSRGINTTTIPRKGRATLSEQSLHAPFASNSLALQGDNTRRLGRKVWGSVAIGSNRGSGELSRAYSKLKQGR